ncbi:MAG: hypothetical protein OHK005_16580 [Candidatus Methylacidiphilales bacterium]
MKGSPESAAWWVDIFRNLEVALASACQAHFGARLVGVLVYGSVGRGTMRMDSDVDVLVVVNDLPSSLSQRLCLFEPVEEALEPVLAEARRSGVQTWVSPVLKRPEELEKGFLLMLDMTEDGRILVDRNGFVERALESFRQRLVRAGAKRIRQGAWSYWDLKPDFKPGDRVEL